MKWQAEVVCQASTVLPQFLPLPLDICRNKEQVRTLSKLEFEECKAKYGKLGTEGVTWALCLRDAGESAGEGISSRLHTSLGCMLRQEMDNMYYRVPDGSNI